MRQLEAAGLFIRAYQKLQVENLLYPECVRVGRGLFRNSRVPHHALILSDFSLTFSAVFNESPEVVERF
jgi:hypothetical protein